MTIVKSLKQNNGYPHRVHRSKKRFKYKKFNNFNSKDKRKKLEQIRISELNIDKDEI